MKSVFAGLLIIVALAPQSRRTFIGTITDAMCEKANHAAMRMGPTDAECAKACAEEHDAAYVLFDGKNVYQLSDQRTPERFAAKKVTVVGTLDEKTKTIHVESITAK
jgi:hypothetical protein